MMLIYTPKITNRLQYIFEEIFMQKLGLKFEITVNKDTFIAHEGVKLNYSSRQFNDELFFYASTLLFERGIRRPPNIKVDEYEDIKIFFISNNNSDLPFDLFAASFYLISRYEEYLPVEKDRFNRFPAQASVAYKNGFLQKPIVDIWVQKLAKVLYQRFPNINIIPRKYRFIPTYDIDLVYAYKHKGFLRNTGGYLVDLKRLNWQEIKLRTKVLLGRHKDPYNTFTWQFELQKKHKLNPIYFFLVSDYGEYDKNISYDSLVYQDLIQSTGDFCEVGIHPSFQSNEDTNIMLQEIKRLARILKKDIMKSRQHYAKLDIPESYQELLELDITHDYTMGYPSEVGFRAGTARPFYFYDLTLESKTRLKVHPFAVMDVTLSNYMQLNTEEALAVMKNLIAEVKAVSGCFISIWHNHSLSNKDAWNGWRDVYEEMVEAAI